MFSQSKNRYRDESAVHKWDQLKQYEDNLESNPHQDFRSNTSSEQSNTLSVIKTFKQLKESGTKTYSSIKTHVTDMYRRKKERSQANGSRYVSGNGIEVSHNPNVMQSINDLGSKIKNSKSLQSLEVVTLDNIRNIVDSATNMGESMKSRYGSRVELQNRRKYDKFQDELEYDSDEDYYRS